MQTPVEVLTADEVQSLLAAPDRSDIQGLRDAAVLATLYYAGANGLEATNLNLGDVERRRKQILLRGEGRVRHRVNLVPELAELLDAYKADSRRLLLVQAGAGAQNTQAFFLGNRGQRIQLSEVRQILGATKKAASISRDVNLVTPRLSRAWHLREAGMSPESIQKFLGAESRSGRRVI
ncbi:MAG: tyrosine-type recombinase/integrase [Acidobacteria bacterium]|nr:tyrosine-type recombinase/integrase [Acidobacteriota bacterium]